MSIFDFNTAGTQHVEQISAWNTPPTTDPVNAFCEKIAEFSLDTVSVVADGKLHRFDVDKKGDKAGWYVFYDGNIPAGVTGNWKTDLKITWCSKSMSSLTWEERQAFNEKQKAAKEKRKREERENHAKAKDRANQIWQESERVTDQNHPYLQKKNIQAHFTRISKNGDLIVPELDENGEIWSLQFIKPDGEKKFQPLGRRDGLYFEMPGAGDHIYLCEGFSTGATIHEATGATVICAFNSGSLPKVARVLKEKYPSSTFTLAADNDQFTAENAGIKKANEAAKILSASVVFPTFANVATKPTDFNDLAALEGKAAVSLQLGQVGKKVVLPPLCASATKIKGRLLSKPKQKEFIWTCRGVGLMPKGVVGVIAATGGTGKTYMMMSLAVMTAAGGAFGPIEATRPLKTLIICGEDDQEEVERRLWHITGGNFPDNLHAASVYGSVGPLMELDGNKPVRAAGFHWLEETIQKHPGLEFLILDPKSRLYGLDENNNDHATQWIQCLEYLSMEYQLNTLFSAHTSDANSNKISQTMNRGASALVDGCRWQSGLIRMDEKMAGKYGLEKPRRYIVWDTPKNNYAPDQDAPLYFKRTDTGVLEYCNPKIESDKAKADFIWNLLKDDPEQHTRRELYNDTTFTNDIKKKFPKFKRDEIYGLIDNLVDAKRIIEAPVEGERQNRKIIKIIDVPF